MGYGASCGRAFKGPYLTVLLPIIGGCPLYRLYRPCIVPCIQALSSDEVEALHTSFEVTWDENGQIASNNASNDIEYTFNWDGKLRKAIWNESPEDSIELKYDPLGNRVYKKSTAGGEATERKYVVDITGKLPVILLEIDPTDSSLKKSYIYADRQILAQHDGGSSAARYFYLHDRLGSVRLVLADDGAVKNTYTYEPFGDMLATECTETTENPFRFTGQWFDSEIEEYYLRARQYNPQIARFTSRDPVAGKLKTPLTLSPYLYCLNDPIDRVDPGGEESYLEMEAAISGHATVSSMALYNFGGQVMALAQQVYAAACIRSMSIGIITARMFGPGGGGQSFNPNQRALIELAKSAKRTGVTREEAKILQQWAAEYGITSADHINQGAHYVLGEHIHIWSYHIKVFLED